MIPLQVRPRQWAPFAAAMAAIVAISNFAVQYPFSFFGLGEILTWGAFTYPISFLVNDLANRRFGPAVARRVVYVGFVFAIVLSAFLATPRIALASGTAFLFAQLLDTSVFDRLRRRQWWQAPLLSTLIGSVLDTILFFGLAFSAQFAFLDSWSGMPDGSLAMPVAFGGGSIALWQSLAIGDFFVKIGNGLAMLVPYGALMRALPMAATR
jgi:uncharacterized PurR-regulated membrane protein YhhQ (DUF165 family)